jgi:hypothetical protein
MEMNDKPRKYLRKAGVRDRYAFRAEKSVDRAVKNGDLPAPDLYHMRSPLWLESTLDKHDDELRERAAEAARKTTEAALKASRKRREREAEAAE